MTLVRTSLPPPLTFAVEPADASALSDCQTTILCHGYERQYTHVMVMDDYHTTQSGIKVKKRTSQFVYKIALFHLQVTETQKKEQRH